DRDVPAAAERDRTGRAPGQRGRDPNRPGRAGRRPLIERPAIDASSPMPPTQLWQRYQRYLSRIPAPGLTLDVSRMGFADGALDHLDPAMDAAFREMDALEKGAIANPDENRMVGHYWLRNPDLAPTPEIAAEIRKTVADVKALAADVHGGRGRPRPA